MATTCPTTLASAHKIDVETEAPFSNHDAAMCCHVLSAARNGRMIGHDWSRCDCDAVHMWNSQVMYHPNDCSDRVSIVISAGHVLDATITKPINVALSPRSKDAR